MGREKIEGESPPGEIRYRANPDFILREVAGEALLVPVGQASRDLNGMITFTETGAFLWKQMMNEPKSIRELATAINGEFDASEQETEKDIRDFIEKAIENNMVMR